MSKLFAGSNVYIVKKNFIYYNNHINTDYNTVMDKHQNYFFRE
ncbi:MAG: hypothetical protein ACI8Y3_000421 [Paraglaciecola sp.]|jgi:hypothetical protein